MFRVLRQFVPCLMMLFFVGMSSSLLGKVTISELSAVLQKPWNGKVNISFSLEGDAADKNKPVFLNFKGKDLVLNQEFILNSLTGDALNGNIAFGKTYSVVWNAALDYPLFNSTDFTISMAVSLPGEYLVVDLSGGTQVPSFPVRYSNEGPDVSRNECRGAELWLRWMPAGKFSMGSASGEFGRNNQDDARHLVTLTKGFYIGVFECTQGQWLRVMGTRPAYFRNEAYFEYRPVEKVSYDLIRGKSSTAGGGWPGCGHKVDDDSFMGQIRRKTGLVFDLPTEAQWEYACRRKADGTFWTTSLNSGMNVNAAEEDSNMEAVGRYWWNGGSDYSASCDYSKGSAKVGSYMPSEMGLYDMQGNMAEWCLDWFAINESTEAATDPVGPSTGIYHTHRGGCWYRNAELCRIASRSRDKSSTSSNCYGFRVALLPQESFSNLIGSLPGEEHDSKTTAPFRLDNCADISGSVANGTALHGGILETDESWGADKVHVVQHNICIPEEMALTIAEGAVVKFCPGTELRVNGTLHATGACFTALADDTAGGDTEMDGSKSPANGTYVISGSGMIEDAGAEWRCCHEAPDGWTSPSGMPYAMGASLTVLDKDGSMVTSAGSLVGFFDGTGLCRGTAELILTAGNKLIYQGYIYSESSNVDELTVAFWNAPKNTVCTIDGMTVEFASGGALGTEDEPAEICAAHHLYVDGEDMGLYEVRQNVAVTASLSPTKEFEFWTAEGMTLPAEQGRSSSLNFVMPDNVARLYSSSRYPDSVAWTLNPGWNWVASNLAPGTTVSNVLRDYVPSDGDRIKTSDCFSTYYSVRKCWDPEIPVVAGQMYAFYRQSADSITVDVHGAKMSADNFVPMHCGWNWIGSISQEDSVALSELMFGEDGFSTGDKVIGCESGETAEFNGIGWTGTLTHLLAGKGYKMYVDNAGNLSMGTAAHGGTGTSAQSVCRQVSENVAKSAGPWREPEGYANSMTMEIMVKNASNESMLAPGSAVGIFDSNGKCRGIAPLRETKWGSKVYSGLVWSDLESENGLSLQFWDAEGNMAYMIQESVDFALDASFGTAASLKLLKVTDTSAGTLAVVVNGTENRGLNEGVVMHVVAPAAPAGQRFVRWNADGISLDNDALMVQNFVMPDRNVTLNAVYEVIDFQAPAGWSQPADGGTVMTISGMVKLLTGEFANEEHSMVAAFDDNGNCCGVGIPNAYLGEQLGCTVYSLQIASNGQTKGLTLKFWSETDGKEQEIEGKVDVSAGAVIGEQSPVVWKIHNPAPDKKYVYMVLKPGWNLLTPSVRLSSEEAQIILAFKPMIVKNNVVSMATAKNLLPGTGMWVYNDTNEDISFMLKGDMVYPWQLEVPSSWKALGALEAVSESNIPEDAGEIFKWDSEAGYIQVFSLEVGNAYWIKKK